MPYIKVWIHFVWSTKHRIPFMKTREMRQTIFNHIRENAKEKGIYIDFINGYTDHVHCLISLGIDQSMSKIMQLLKGESSFWVNKNGICEEKFEWQDEYFAISVSESIVDRVRNYIKRQEEHHQKKTYAQEYDELIEKYGFEKFRDT
ncbi:IS200/IS605 family transposase [Runella aurantiaca]|uniref:IS200/IS605 family transposase n=1 Tax=Runella aurantiaca TaxID=2282308 RepID=A0A369IAU0_9BACT|nr:IS200/IS605 family transposase [Runella aurantiaca]RDB06162.1 IS200/IS605 family transposase [Runella aurantiaca]